VNSSLFGNPKSFSVGAYSVADFTFNFPLKLSFGLRYDLGKLDTLSPSSSLNPKLGLNYKLSEDLIIRSSIGTGFRNPSLAEAFTSTTASGLTVKPNPKIKPEKNVTFEIGFNYQFEPLFEIDFAIFQNEYFKMIEASVDPLDGKIFFNNIVRARIQGIELSTKINIISGLLNAAISYTYLNSKDVEKNIPLKYRPEHSFLSSIEFTYSHLSAGVFFKYHSKVKEIDRELIDLGIVRDGELRVPIYQTDLSLSYDLVGLSLPMVLYFNIYNLFNYNYVELIGNLRPIRSFSFGLNLIF
jgi:iron complex outermembrane receptor protein